MAMFKFCAQRMRKYLRIISSQLHLFYYSDIDDHTNFNAIKINLGMNLQISSRHTHTLWYETG
jgi:hypothetical protein